MDSHYIGDYEPLALAIISITLHHEHLTPLCSIIIADVIEICSTQQSVMEKRNDIQHVSHKNILGGRLGTHAIQDPRQHHQ